MRKLILSLSFVLSALFSFAQQQFDIQGHSTTGSDTYTVSITNLNSYEVGSSPVRGVGFSIIFDTSSSGACSLNVNGLGAIPINGDITSGVVYRLEYNVVTDEFDIISSTGSGVSLGTEGQIPVMNSTDDDFVYSDKFKWDDTDNNFIAGNGTIVSGTNNHNLGDNTSITGSWVFTTAEDATIYGNNSISAGWTFEVGDGVNTGSGSATTTFGTDHKNYGTASYVGGVGGQVSYNYPSRGGFVHAFSVGSVDGLKPSGVEYLIANDGAFNVSRNTANQTAGHGALAQDAAILGGTNHNIPSTSPRSVIIGGDSIKARASDPDNVYVPYLNVTEISQDDTLTQIVARDGTTGKIFWRDASTLGGGVVTQTITNGVTTTAPSEDAVFDGLASTLASAQAYADALVGTYTRLASINAFASVDPTGVTECSAAIQAGLNDSDYDSYIFDGVYKITSSLTIPTGKRVYLRSGTDVQVFTGSAGNVSAFILNTRSGVDGEQGSFISCTASTKNQYGITVVNGAYGWSILGRIEIRNFGRHGMYFLSAVSAPNQYKTGTVVDVIVSGTSAITGSYGDGIKVDGGTEYVRFINVESTGSAGYGINILGANNPVIGGALVANTAGGLRVQGGASNSDHFLVTGTTINHNTGPAFTGVDIDTGFGLTGAAMFGNGSLFNISNCQGISFSGCGIDIGTACVLQPGATGDGLISIFGGYSLTGSQTDFKAALTGGGFVNFYNVAEILPSGYTTYTSNFSAGVDSWADNGTTSTGNIDAVSDGSTSFDNTLRIAGDGNNSTHYITRTTTLTNGAKYRLSIVAYIPTANTTVDGFEISDSGTLSVTPSEQVKGKWRTFDIGEFTATGTTLQINTKSAGTATFTSPTTDYVYIARIILKAL